MRIYAIGADCAVPIARQRATLEEARVIAWECYMHDRAGGNIRSEALDYQILSTDIEPDSCDGVDALVLYSAALPALRPGRVAWPHRSDD